MAGSLSEVRVEQYQRAGFLCPVDVLTPAEAAALRAALEGRDARYGAGGLPRPISQYHRVNANLVSVAARMTDDRRIGFVARFIRPDTPKAGKGNDYAMLARGCDRTRSRINVAPPPGSFSPAALALYEEVLAAQSSTLAAGAEAQVSFYQTEAGGS